MSVARIAEIHRYPVKSMQGERVDEVSVGVDGLRGDRSWAVRDEARSGIEGARKLPALLGCRARYLEPLAKAGEAVVPEIELPDGTRLQASDPAASARLSELTGRELSLWPRHPSGDLDHYRRGAADHDDLLDELRAIFGRLPDEPLPDLARFPPESLASATIPGTYFDCYPVFLLTRASLDTLQAASPASNFDARRFRPNLLLDEAASGGFPENDWVGRRLRVGSAVLRIAMECPRCVMTTHGFDDLPRDSNVMRELVKQNGGNLGVYAAVDEPGSMTAGDGVELLD